MRRSLPSQLACSQGFRIMETPSCEFWSFWSLLSYATNSGNADDSCKKAGAMDCIQSGQENLMEIKWCCEERWLILVTKRITQHGCPFWVFMWHCYQDILQPTLNAWLTPISHHPDHPFELAWQMVLVSIELAEFSARTAPHCHRYSKPGRGDSADGQVGQIAESAPWILLSLWRA